MMMMMKRRRKKKKKKKNRKFQEVECGIIIMRCPGAKTLFYFCTFVHPTKTGMYLISLISFPQRLDSEEDKLQSFIHFHVNARFHHTVVVCTVVVCTVCNNQLIIMQAMRHGLECMSFL